MSIFKAYDIRGVVGDELGPDDAYAIGRASVRFLAASPLLVGRDARPSSPALCEALVRGIQDEGADVLDAGLASTPMVYFGVEHTAAAGGISVTASHNPARYNGFKIKGDFGGPAHPEMIAAVEKELKKVARARRKPGYVARRAGERTYPELERPARAKRGAPGSDLFSTWPQPSGSSAPGCRYQKTASEAQG